MDNMAGRRPLKVRNATVINKVASKLNRMNISPNQISIASILFALLCGICLVTIGMGFSIWLSWLGAFFIQCRLLCNLFDGMVAVEGGKSTPSGELFNDIPDRISDPLILASAGYAITLHPWAMELGWLASILAVLTAYIRTLATSMGAPASFIGPMAKQHRMAIMTLALVLMPIETLVFDTHGHVLFMALVIICLGAVITIINRTRQAYRYLEFPGQEDNNAA